MATATWANCSEAVPYWCCTSVENQRNFTQTGVYGRRGVRHVRDERGSPDIGTVEVARLHVEVLRETDDSHGPHGNPSREQAVYVPDLQAAIGECSPSGLGHDLRLALLGSPARRVFINPGDGD